MRTTSLRRIAFAKIIVLASGMAGSFAQADPLPAAPPLVLPDPSPRDSHDFPAALATSGTADPGHALGSIPVGGQKAPGCNALNPCAEPPPSLQHVDSSARPG
jgi:hypothetical protein